MAQIIKHKRGNLEGLASATTRAGELLVVTGSTGLGTIANGDSLVFVGIDGSTATPVNKILQGTTVPNLTGVAYNTHVDGIPFFDTDDQKLYILNKGGNIEVKATPQTGATGIVSGSDQVVLQSADKTGFTGATSITTLGTIATGVWNGTAISTTYLSGQSGTNTGDETLASINGLGITTVGTIDSGTWNGSVIASAYLDSDTAHLSGTQTFSGAKTFSSQLVSSVATGTAPFAVTSTTKVTNLNADKLDGLTSGDFLRSNADDSASGVITLTNTTATNATDVGALVVQGGVGIGGALNVAGDVVAYASSDERLKDNIELISNPIEKVQSLKGVTWDWNDNADELQQSLPNVGVIAQDVEKVLPELVTDRDNGYKGVDYAKLTGLLIEAIKEQQKEINDLKSKIK